MDVGLRRVSFQLQAYRLTVYASLSHIQINTIVICYMIQQNITSQDFLTSSHSLFTVSSSSRSRCSIWIFSSLAVFSSSRRPSTSWFCCNSSSFTVQCIIKPFTHLSYSELNTTSSTGILGISTLSIQQNAHFISKQRVQNRPVQHVFTISSAPILPGDCSLGQFCQSFNTKIQFQLTKHLLKVQEST